MAKFDIWKADVVFECSLALGEKEARALHALARYGSDQFLKMFYEHLGSSLKGHEEGLHSLFAATNSHLANLLDKTNDARKIFKSDAPCT